MARKKSEKTVEKAVMKLSWKVRIIAMLIIAALLAVSMLFENSINYALGLKKISESEYSGTTNTEVLASRDVEDLTVHFVNVGQGDACIIEFPDDKTMIIDGGEKDAKDELLEYIETNVKDDNGNTIEYFDYALLTHSDSDHCGSLDDVLNAYPAKNFYRPNILANKKGYDDPGKSLLTGNYASKDTTAYMACIEAGHKGAENVFINDYTLEPIVSEGIAEGEPGYYELSFYGPNSEAYDDWNNYSPIMILEYEGHKIALSGDCEKEGEAEFVEKVNADEGKFAEFDDAFSVGAIKLGHHGSGTSSSEDYLNVMTTPESIENTFIIISCGFDNKYEHPHDVTMKRLEKMGFSEDKILRTDENGDIVLSVRKDETSGEVLLFHGADAVKKSQEKLIDWRYIATVILVAALGLLIVQPLATKNKRKKR